MLQFLKNKLTQFSFESFYIRLIQEFRFMSVVACHTRFNSPWLLFLSSFYSFVDILYLHSLIFIIRTSINFKLMPNVFGNSIIFLVKWTHFLFISLLSGMLSYPIKDLNRCFPLAKSSQVTNHNSRCSVNVCKLLILVDLCDFLFLFSCLNYKQT